MKTARSVSALDRTGRAFDSNIFSTMGIGNVLPARNNPSTVTDRIAFFIPDFSLGGAERVTVNIANGLVDRGHKVDVLVSRDAGELRGFVSDQVRVVSLAPSRPGGLGVAAHLPALERYINRTGPAAIFPHLEHPSIVCLTINATLNPETMIIPTQHSPYGVSREYSFKDRIVKELVPRLYPSADRIIAVSDGVATSLQEATPISDRKVTVLNNPIDIDRIRTKSLGGHDNKWLQDSDHTVVLFVGRLAVEKDLDTWLRAFSHVSRRHSNLRAILLGTGPQRERILRLADELSIRNKIMLPGFESNPYPYMRDADLLLLSSRYEGLPTVVIEALACGCQVVSTDCPGGVAEILAHGEFGRLAPVGDHLELSNSVAELLANPIPETALKCRASAYRMEKVMDQYNSFIQEFILSDND